MSSHLDPFFDRAFIDLKSEIQTIQQGRKREELFSLVPFMINTKHFDLQSIHKSFENVHKNISTLCFAASQAQMQRSYESLQRSHDLLNKSISSRLNYATEFCILQHGTHALLITSIFLTFKRFHHKFGLPDFLFCSISNLSPDCILRQMIQSQLNFMLYGEYLPIIIVFTGQRHATAILIIPVAIPDDHRVTSQNPSPSPGLNPSPNHGQQPSNDSDTESDDGGGRLSTNTKWNFIFINPNGSNIKWQKRFDDIPRQAFQDFRKFFSAYQVNGIFQEWNCVENIQKNYGSCGPWSILLSFHIFANINPGADNLDFISVFCNNLARKTQNSQTHHRFHQCIIDFIYLFQHLTLKVLKKAAEHAHLLVPTFSQFVDELVRGSVPANELEVEAKIFQTMGILRGRFQKYMAKVEEKRGDTIDTGDTGDTTDDETDMEKKYKSDFEMQRKQIEPHNLRCIENQYKLMTLKGNIQLMCVSPDYNKCQLSRLKRQFREKAREQLLALTIFSSRGQNAEEWLQIWFERRLKEELKKVSESKAKLEILLRTTSKISDHEGTVTKASIKDIETKLQHLNQHQSHLTTQLDTYAYMSDASDFLKFVNGVEISIKNLNTIQNALMNLKHEIEETTKSEETIDAKELLNLHGKFRKKYNQLLLHIENTFHCGTDPRDWLDEWFRSEMFREIQNSASASEQQRDQLWQLYTSNRNKELSTQFLTFVGKNQLFIDTDFKCAEILKTLVEMKSLIEINEQAESNSEIRQEFQEKSGRLASFLQDMFRTTAGRRRWIESWFREASLARVAQYFSRIEELDNELDEFREHGDTATIHALQQQIRDLDEKRLLFLDSFNKKMYIDDASEFITFSEKIRKRSRLD
jgi:hypothetical protein